ncbi:MAG: pentapeptide repeat-containing protein [Fusobacteriaceae bacterium]
MEEVKVMERYKPEEKDKEENHKKIEKVCRELGLVDENYNFTYEMEIGANGMLDRFYRMILPKEVCEEATKLVQKGINDFSLVIFKGNANFFNAIFKGHTNFRMATINGDANFREVKICGDINFSWAIISGKVDFYLSKIEGNAIFSCSVIKGDADFGSTISGEIDFSNALIGQNARFSGAIINGKTNFYSTNIGKSAYFNEAHLRGQVDFSLVNFKEYAYFPNAIFCDRTDFFCVTFNRNPDFSKATFEKYLYFDISEIDYLAFDDIHNLLGTEFLVMKDESYDKIKKCSRNTWRLLKHIAIENHNKILANKLLRKEMTAYHEELKEKIKPTKFGIIFRKFSNFLLKKTRIENFFIKAQKFIVERNYEDRIILFFNKWSNNYGLSWWRGIWTTVSLTLLLYFISQFFTSKFIFIGMDGFTLKIWGNFLVEYINSLINFEILNKELHLGVKFFLLLEKIFLVLGIFRINQAFRKLNDKG